jgi:hypothetical protein
MKNERFFGVRVIARAAHLVPPAPAPLVTPAPEEKSSAETKQQHPAATKPRRRHAAAKKSKTGTPDLFEVNSKPPKKDVSKKARSFAVDDNPPGPYAGGFEVPVGG